MSDLDPYSAARVADRMEIQDAIYRWCRGVDRLDFDAIRSVFHPDAEDDHGSYKGGVDGLIEWVRQRHRTIPCSVHKIGQILIEFGSADVAVAESYVETLQHYPPGAGASLAQLTGGSDVAKGQAVDLMGRSRYVDRFERRGGRWRIARRTLVFDWRGVVEVPARGPLLPADWNLGRRGPQDHLYLERARAGIDQTP
jgi:ketosteroid isomerase-like protein